MIKVADIKTKLNGKLHGTSLNKISDLYGKMREASSNVLSRIDPYTTIRNYTIQNALHDMVYSYTAPDDLKGNSKVVDIRPISQRTAIDDIGGTFSKEFDTRKQNRTFTVEVINGVKTLKIAKRLYDRIQINALDNTNLTATVTGNADIDTITLNYQNYLTGNAAISFNLLGGGQGILTIDLLQSVSLKKLVNTGALFHWINLPDASGITNIKLRWGTDSFNYFEQTITSPHDRTSFESGAWLLNRYNWLGATETGTVDTNAISHIEIEINYTNGPKTGVLVNSLTASIGKAYEMLYYSNRIFRGVDGSYKEAPTLDSDIVLLDVDSENIFIYELAILCSQEIKGANFAADFAFWTAQLEGGKTKMGLYRQYEQNYPSQAIQHSTTYHNYSDFGSEVVGAYRDEADFDDLNEYI